MAYLNSTERNLLEKSVLQARTAAESGALNALKALAVHHHEPYGSMEPEKRLLRNRLRYKGRLLGDILESKGVQQLDNLASELAYEYWHKMLFAKFLEVNGLLMHPDGVPVSLQECEELAPAEKFLDKWHAASVYASKMLPALFRPEDPLMAVEFATEDRLKLESVLEAIPDDIYRADDSLGWVYQFWQSEAKERINKSGDKIDGKRLPAVTQLFTEPYMVHFLIDNTLGAWWVSRNPGVRPPVEFKYLRMIKSDTVTNGSLSGAEAGSLSGAEAGSQIEAEVGSLSGAEVGSLSGAEVPAAGTFDGWPEKTKDIASLDPCMGSGHFIVAQFEVFVRLRMLEEGLSPEEAAKVVIKENLHGLELDPRCTQIAAFNLALAAWKFCGRYIQLPEMKLACSGVAPKGTADDWVKLVGHVEKQDDRVRLQNGMRMLYQHFQLAPELGSLLDPSSIKPDAFTASFEELEPVLNKALLVEADAEQYERGVLAAGIAKTGLLLVKKYTLQITNVPYLSRGKQDKVVADFIERNYKEAKGDLATVFLEKMLKANVAGGISATVIPQNWLFLTSYKKFREKLLRNENWNIIARLGPKGFQTPMWDFNVMLISISHSSPLPDHRFAGLDVSEATNAAAKDEAIKNADLKIVNQNEQLGNPDARIVIGEEKNHVLLEKYASAWQGIATGDYPRFGRFFGELIEITSDWVFNQSTVVSTKHYGGKENILYWEDGLIHEQNPNARVQGLRAWGKKGIVCSQMGDLPVTLYSGTKFDNNSSVITFYDNSNLTAIWCFCSSPKFNEEVRKIDQALKVTNATLVKVPFDLEYWQKVAAEKYPKGLPKPYSDDPTQWLFHGNPQKTENPLQVAIARYLGYRWPAETDEKMELAEEAREMINYITPFNHLSDEDGIFCIPSVYGELEAAVRIREYLSEIYGKTWSHDTLEKLLKQEGAKATTLEGWLRDEFFEQHYKLFNNRPFIWQIWDGRKDGFSALVNYHKLTKENLQKLIYTYLGDWIRQCELKIKNGESGADGLLIAANKLKEKLELILTGENPYDIFVRWKKLEEQPVGWEPDINDGVRLNIRPFMEADILRKKPNIKWGIDRGKNPPGTPWGEVRDNDRHLSLKEKLEAREKSGKTK